ncbi:MAG: tRNA ((37)-C2)-methylthiotransferase MiaB [Bacteroidota bacterium]
MYICTLENVTMTNIIADIDIIKETDKEACELARISEDNATPTQKKLYIESYGCQMNFSDSEIVTSIMIDLGYGTTSNYHEADVIFLNTCSIRDNAEVKVRKRLAAFGPVKKKNKDLQIGVLGCMAERLKAQLLDEEKLVDMVVGPDAYKSLPSLLAQVDDGHKAVNVFLSREETYADITPVRLNSNGLCAYISIMRGCDNMCSFCIVPYTRGRERSRDANSIVKEAHDLFNQGYKEVTLLGQNVDSYHWQSEDGLTQINFAQLLEKVALVNPLLRIRFSTSHPKDITDEVLYTMKKYHNICKYIHLPAQSGNNRILDIMSRAYTREWYLGKIEAIHRIMEGECAISTDIIVGFCGETEEEHQDTLNLFKEVRYNYAYMFAYSERPGTPAAKNLVDDITAEVKQRRLAELIALERKITLEKNNEVVGKTFEILVEGPSKRNEEEWGGRNSQYQWVIFPKKNCKKGDYVQVKITHCTTGTLNGEIVG